jgi:hypothetical protein
MVYKLIVPLAALTKGIPPHVRISFLSYYIPSDVIIMMLKGGRIPQGAEKEFTHGILPEPERIVFPIMGDSGMIEWVTADENPLKWEEVSQIFLRTYPERSFSSPITVGYTPLGYTLSMYHTSFICFPP